MKGRKVYLVFSGGILVAIMFAVLVFVSRGAAKHFVLEGVYFNGHHLAGMSYEDAGELIDDAYVDLLDQRVVIEIDGKRRKLSLVDLGVSFDTRKSIQSVKDYSYGGNLFTHLQTRITGWRGGKVRVKPVFEVDYGDLEQVIYATFPEVQPAREAELKVLDDRMVEVAPHRKGLAVDVDDAYRQLVLGVEKMDLDEISPRVKVSNVEYTTEDAMDDAKMLEWFLAKEVKLLNPQFEFELAVLFRPEWVEIRSGEVTFDRHEIARFLEEKVAASLDVYKTDLEIVGLPETEVGYVELDGEIRDGRRVLIASTLENMLRAFADDRFAARVEIVQTKGEIVNSTEVEMGEFQLISQGRSNFKGSTAGRAFNVNKGLNEKMNNIIIAPGATFDFNSFLGPVTYSAGWKDALAIFNGKDLEPVAGGGLCQVSTTVYRAALNAGFDVLEQRNHSLYVHYYREYGNGLDATIYPGQQNLKFVNNSGNYVLLQAWTEGDDAYVNFYGSPDGRRVDLIGPYYSGTVPEEYRDQISLSRNQIAWVHKVTWPNGEVNERILKSSYKNSILR